MTSKAGRKPGLLDFGRLPDFFVAAFVSTFVEKGVDLTSWAQHAIRMFVPTKLAVYRKALPFDLLVNLG